jgi:hypothetical protein
MKNWREGKKLLAAVIFCVILPGMLALLLLAGSTYAQTDRPAGFQNLLTARPQLEMSAPLPARSGTAHYLPPKLHRALLRQLAASRWWQTNLPDPLPSPSIFATQTDLCKYEDKWPVPGLTVCPGESLPPVELTDNDLR